LEKKTVESNT